MHRACTDSCEILYFVEKYLKPRGEVKTHHRLDLVLFVFLFF
jgi:hypothetical protein